MDFFENVSEINLNLVFLESIRRAEPFFRFAQNLYDGIILKWRKLDLHS